MTRGFLKLIIALIVVQAIVESAILFAWTNFEKFGLTWRETLIFLVTLSVIATVNTFNLLRYFAWKKLWWTFYSGLLSGIVSIVHMYALYLYLTHEITWHSYMVFYYLSWTAILLFALAVIISRARKNFWLQLYAWPVLVISAVKVTLAFIPLDQVPAALHTTIDYLITANVIFLCVHFITEIRNFEQTNDNLIDI